MSEWKVISIGDAPIEIIDGDRSANYPKLFELLDAGDIPFLNSKAIKNFKLDYSEIKFLNREKADSIRKGKTRIGDIVMTTRGNGIGKLILYNDLNYDYAVINAQMLILRSSDNELLPQFLYHLLKNGQMQEEFYINSSGSAQPQLPIFLLKNINIKIPPIANQKFIVSILSSLDDKIGLLHRQNTTLEKMTETLFRKWFVEEAKEEWELSPLSSIADFLNGLACQKYPPKNEIDKLPVLKIKELSNGITDNSDWATTDVRPEYHVSNGDVIFAWSASLMVKIWDGQACVLNQHLFKVTSNTYPKWFYYLWCKHHLAEFITKAASHATTMGHIKRGDLDEALVLIPSDAELKEMTSVAEPLIDKIINNNRQITLLVDVRDTLIPKLMRGEVIVIN